MVDVWSTNFSKMHLLGHLKLNSCSLDFPFAKIEQTREIFYFFIFWKWLTLCGRQKL